MQITAGAASAKSFQSISTIFLINKIATNIKAAPSTCFGMLKKGDNQPRKK
jgi:hypothetical protein